jgi:hypothetical protein
MSGERGKDSLEKPRAARRRLAIRLLPVAALSLISGCMFYRGEPQPFRTTFKSSVAVLPAETFGNILVIQAKWDRYGPYHFLIDTGSSVTLVTPEFAARYSGKSSRGQPSQAQVRAQAGSGSAVILPTTVVERLQLGSARFTGVPALVYDCAPLTAQFGVKIDGILGFPLFHETLLTLDYRHNRVLIRPNASVVELQLLGSAIPFDNADNIPIIPVQLGTRRFVALIDSGSETALSLNPAGLAPQFIFGPAQGPTVDTLNGSRTRQIGRLAQSLLIGDYSVAQPITELNDELSAVGGGILRNFTVTFDQKHGRVTFYRESNDPVTMGGLNGTGLSFGKTPAYWRVVGVVPGSPADAARVEIGDLITRIDGEPVSQWGFHRYENLIATSSHVVFTFLNGTRESDKRMAVVRLVR